MLSINLLPLQEKKIVHYEDLLRIVRFFTIEIMVVFGSGAVFLLPSYLPLYLEYRELTRALSIEEGASQQFQVTTTVKEVKSVEAMLNYITTFAQHSSRASKLVHSLFPKTEGIRLNTLTVKKEGNIVMNGFAETRDNLLAFETSLRAGGIFQEITFPLSNITKQSDINFTIQGKLKSEYQL